MWGTNPCSDGAEDTIVRNFDLLPALETTENSMEIRDSFVHHPSLPLSSSENR